MKRNVYWALMIIALGLIVSVPMIQAQNGTRANVPFEFNLNQQSMPAGNYEISSLNEKVLAVQSLETGETRMLIASMHVQASQAAGIPHAKVVFHKYGDQYFLSQIWDGQSDIGIAFPESKREKELQWAHNSYRPELVVIAMK